MRPIQSEVSLEVKGARQAPMSMGCATFTYQASITETVNVCLTGSIQEAPLLVTLTRADNGPHSVLYLTSFALLYKLLTTACRFIFLSTASTQYTHSNYGSAN